MSRFVINVTKNGDRFFSTSRASIGTDDLKAADVLLGMQAGFPESAGYKVECFYIATTANAIKQKLSDSGVIQPDDTKPALNEMGPVFGEPFAD